MFVLLKKINTFKKCEYFNKQRQIVSTLLDQPQTKGAHFVDWKGLHNNGNSVYNRLLICELKTDTKKLPNRIVFDK